MYTFLMNRDTTLSTVFGVADYDELIKIYIKKTSMAPITFVVKKEHGKSKNKNLKIMKNGVLEMLNYERIPNLASKFKSKNI